MQALASQQSLGTSAKTVFCCERHALCATPVNVLLFLITSYVIFNNNPEASRNHSPFSRMGRKKSLVQDTH
jgi:hypothetical protein